MEALTRQVAAWRDSWERLPDDGYERRSFLARVGYRLGEDDEEAAIRKASAVIGVVPPRDSV